jgi:polynucleotide 5'-hydroxyl-kinase GRC3/NOL9
MMRGSSQNAFSVPGGTIKVEEFWRDLLALLERDPSWRTVFVLGLTDSGKTTLCRFLGRELARHWPTARVDGDPGQSFFGPPACLGLAWEPWDGNSSPVLRFVGSTSPMRHFLQTLTGIKRLVDHAFEEGAQKVVLDSSGYMNTDAGREFHFQTLDLLEPDYLVALQQADEMEPLLASFARRVKPRLHRLQISPAVVGRSWIERRLYREEKFKRYFQGATAQVISLENLGIHGMVPALDRPESYYHRMVALCDCRGFVSVLGIVEQIELDKARLYLYAPPFQHSQIASVQFGSISLERSGRETSLAGKPV